MFCFCYIYIYIYNQQSPFAHFCNWDINQQDPVQRDDQKLANYMPISESTALG